MHAYCRVDDLGELLLLKNHKDILMSLSSKDASVVELSHKTGYVISIVGFAVDEMEEKGLVNHRRSPSETIPLPETGEIYYLTDFGRQYVEAYNNLRGICEKLK